MYILDTDTLTHLLLGHQRVIARRALITEEVALTVITRIEVLQGRFASLFKAENGEKLMLAQQRLLDNERDLDTFIIVAVNSEACVEFDRLRQNKKVKIHRGDLLIAAIALAHRATLVTRIKKTFAMCLACVSRTGPLTETTVVSLLVDDSHAD